MVEIKLSKIELAILIKVLHEELYSEETDYDEHFDVNHFNVLGKLEDAYEEAI